MDRFELTFPQKNIYLLEKFYGKSSLNNIIGTLNINYGFNKEVCEKAISKMIELNDALRLKLTYDENGEVCQVVDKESSIDIEHIKVSAVDMDEVEQTIVNEPFGITNGNLIKFYVIDFENGKGRIYVKQHHLISDAWTCSNIATYLSRYIDAFEKNEIVDEIIPSYIDFINSEKSYCESEKYEVDKSFWREYLNGITETVKLKEKATNGIFDAKRYESKLPEELSKKIKEYCKENKTTPYTIFMNALAIYIYRVTEKRDIVIGTPILNRSNFKEKKMLGMFVSTMPVRYEIDENTTFNELSRKMSSEFMTLFRHQKYPYSRMIEDFRQDSDLQDNLYNCMLSYQNARASFDESGKFGTDWIFSKKTQNQLEIHIMDIDETGTLTVVFDYLTSLFEDKEIEYIATRLFTIIQDGIDNNKTIGTIEIMSEEEKNKILYEFNDTKTDYPKDKTVIDLFEEQVEKTPDKVAVVFESKKLTYSELNKKANILANHLIKQGVCEKDNVAITLDKSIELMVAIIAVLKVGACYVPVDIDYTNERKEYILKDASCKINIVSSVNDEIFSVKPLNIQNEDLGYNENNIQRTNDYNWDSLVYIMYTSGTTGKPKGTMVTNRNIVRLVKNTNYIEFMEDDRIIQTGATVFDACTFEYWGALLNGLELYLIKKEDMLDPKILSDFLIINGITIMFITTSLFNQMLEVNPKIFERLRVLLTGGEVMSLKHINIAIKNNINTEISNIYGPTENTTFSNFCRLYGEQAHKVPIGIPISNTTSYIMDTKNRLLPMFVDGELCLGGDGVAKGYLNNLELTKNKFVNDPYSDGVLYRCGDICNIGYNGNVNFIGRRDNQVKIHGFRIELDEIKNVALEIPYVKDAIAVVKEENENKKIYLYIVSDSKQDINSIRNYLKEKLPQYMMPNGIMQIDSLPLNSNGKTDIKSLPNILDDLYDNEASNNDITENQKEIINIINSINGIKKQYNIYENILNYLDSLLLIQLSIELRNKFKADISIGDMIKGITISDIDNIICKAKGLEETETTLPSDQLNNGQRGIFANYVKDTESLNYNIPFEIRFEKNINVEKLKNSIERVINNIPNIFTHIEIEETKFYSKTDNKRFELDINKLSEEQYEIIKEKFVKPFDLLEGPLFRINLYETDKFVYLLFDFHHIIFDGASVKLLMDKIKMYYEENKLEYNVVSKKIINIGKYNKDKEYFLNEFSGELPINNLPLDNSRIGKKTYNGNNIIIQIDEDITNQIRKYAKQKGVTINSIMLSAYNLLLAKYMYNEDIIIGLATLGRKTKDELETIGMFVKTIPFRTNINYNENVLNYIKCTQSHVIDSIEHDEYPYEDLVKDLNVERDVTRNPLFDTLYTYQNSDISKVNIGGNVGIVNELPTRSSKFDITCQIENLDNNIRVNMEYCTDIISTSMASDFTKHYVNIIQNMIKSNDETKLSDISMILNSEKEKIVNIFNNTKTYYPDKVTATKIFEENVKKYSEKTAVVFEDRSLTYNELNEKANQIAHKIIEIGIAEGSVVALMMDKSIEFMIGVLGILKANCIYMPMDKSMPKERMKFVLQDSNSALILTTKKYYKNISKIKEIFIDIDNEELYNDKNKENINLKQNSEAPAYIIYTSGSTGVPKGNTIIHKGITRLVLNTNYLNISNKDVMLVSGSLTFDTSVFEIWGAMLYGMTLHFISKENIVNPPIYKEYINNNKITTTLIPTPIFNQLVEYDAAMFKNMNQVCVGGDVLLAKYTNQVYEKCPNLILTNIYGPAENAVLCSAHTIDKKYYGSIPIGKVTSNSTCYVIDKTDNLCPPRVPGELCVGGDGLGLGYLNKPELTRERFVVPKCLDEKIYRTGDLASWNTDGTLNFKGRIDFQIKIRGQRIEIFEIQNKILEIKEIKEVIVVARENELGNKYLVAYYTLNSEYKKEDIENYLRRFLPTYMIPSNFVLLEQMPLNQNGKIDRRALPEVKEQVNQIRLEPIDEEQKTILEVYRSVLDNNEFYMNDNFFEKGGDSLLAMKLISEASVNNIKMDYSQIFDNPTPLEMLEIINKKKIDNSLQEAVEQYDYTEINELLTNPSKEIIITNKNDILLTGAAGFLGSHILDKLLSFTDARVYCLIRRKNNMDPKTRLKERLQFFFGNKYDNYFDNRIIVVEGDITFEKLFTYSEDAEKVKQNVGSIINSAAVVQHYGKKELFDSININGVNNLIKYSLDNNVKLIQISTLSVSGNMIEVGQVEQNGIKDDVYFTEKNLYIGQNLNNLYVYSKFIGERNILENIIKNNLNANIIRVGNLTGRFSDGMFQPNIDDNAFVNRIKSFINLESVPENMVNLNLEFTPIDLVSEAITNIIKKPSNNIIYHAYNINHIKLKDLINNLDKLNIKIKILNENDQKSKIKELLENRKTDKIQGIVLDINENNETNYETNIHVDGRQTERILADRGFVWPDIDKEYINKYFNYLINKKIL